MVKAWLKHLRPILDQVEIYDVPPSRNEARLHANESSWGWPVEVVEELAAELRAIELNRYPDTSARELRAVIADRLDCEVERIVLGNGSAEIVGLFYALLNGGAKPVLVVPVPAFAMFASSGRAYGFEVRQVPLRRDLDLDVSAMRRALGGATLCVITRPNNPTGSLYRSEVVASLIAEFPDTIFIVDEAYAPYAPGCSMFSAEAPSNQVHLATFSKHGLAALRIGYCAADPELARALDKMRMPYNLPQTSIALARVLLTRHPDVLDRMARETIERREEMRRILARITGATVHPSSANMVLVSLKERAHARHLQRALLARGVHVRDVSDEAGFAELGFSGCLRVSTGSAAELGVLARAVADIERERNTVALPPPSAGGEL